MTLSVLTFFERNNSSKDSLSVFGLPLLLGNSEAVINPEVTGGKVRGRECEREKVGGSTKKEVRKRREGSEVDRKEG